MGVARFGSVKSLGTATAAVFDLRTAQDLFGKQGRYDAILAVGRDGTSGADVRKRRRRRRGLPTPRSRPPPSRIASASRG